MCCIAPDNLYLSLKTQMTTFSENLFTEKFDFVELEQPVASTVRLATQYPVSLYLFFQRYTYFNG